MGKACGNPNCKVSNGINDVLTFGSGDLDFDGFWEHPCAPCARLHEKRYPKDGKCWPYPDSLTRAERLVASAIYRLGQEV